MPGFKLKLEDVWRVPGDNHGFTVRRIKIQEDLKRLSREKFHGAEVASTPIELDSILNCHVDALQSESNEKILLYTGATPEKLYNLIFEGFDNEAGGIKFVENIGGIGSPECKAFGQRLNLG